ncbi:MAG: nucleotidyltransferase family protein [Oscillospiraceae bacterium]|nr:nucleotidyltransferase family protein [Oscillospiraceae bacterium]
MISKENQMMLQILGHALHETESEPIVPSCWPAIYKEMKAQTVFAIPADYINLNQLEDAEEKEYRMMVGRNIQYYHTVMAEQQKLLDTLEKAGIPTVILKGSSAAMNYPEPAYRCMGDIDLIVKPDDFEKAYHTMCDAGYDTKETLEKYYRHIGFHSSKGIHIELHSFFSTSRNAEQNQILDQYIYNGIGRGSKGTLTGYRTSSLPELENGLVLLAHINQHIGGGLGLRQVIDWMCFAEKHLTDEFWNSTFSEAAESIGMKKLAAAVTATCRKYLSMNADITWCNDTEDSLCDELMEYILAHGNFGRKNATNATTISVLRWFRNPIHGFRHLQEIGCRTWKILDKCKWLTPFAWFYQMIRLIHHGIKRGVTLSSAKESKKQELTETEFLRKIGITRL